MTPLLGKTLVDRVTGFTGIATQHTLKLSGASQYALQPKTLNAGVVPPDAMYIDEHLLAVMDDGVSDSVTKAVVYPITLGDEVKCKLTGYKGIASSKLTFLNGCVFYSVIPKMESKATEIPRGEYIDGLHLEVTKSSAFKTPEKASRPPGGPMQRVARNAVFKG